MEDRYLFKAKRIYNGEWIVGNLITNAFFRLGQSIPYILCPDKAKYDCFEDFTEENGIFEVRPDTICRCTGLNDKKGDLIWENDIVKINNSKVNVLITFRDFEIICTIPNEKYYKHRLEYDTEYEVIGNIFDNPELLGRNDELV